MILGRKKSFYNQTGFEGGYDTFERYFAKDLMGILNKGYRVN